MRRARLLVTLAALLLAPALASRAQQVEEVPTRPQVAEQQARLPAAMQGCTDAIEGDWLSQLRLRGKWSHRVLHIRRAAPGSEALTGFIDTHVFDGPETEQVAYPCSSGRTDYVGVQPAEGRWDGQTLQFGGTAWQLTEARCGSQNYFPDHFTGSLQADGNEFHSQNVDAGGQQSIVVFRRIRCVDGAVPAAPTPAPAPITPPPPPRAAHRGCGCLPFGASR